MPIPDVDMEDIPDLTDDMDDEDEEPYIGEDVLEDSNHIFLAMIPCKAEFV